MLDKIMQNKDKILRNTVSYMLVFVILFVKGCFNFVNFDWDFGVAFRVDTAPKFWVDIAMQSLLLVLIKSLAFSIFIDYARNKNQELNFEMKNNDSLMKLKGQDFYKYIEEIKNKETKINAWNTKINKDIAKLEKKASIHDRILYFDDSEEVIAERNCNKYCNDRKDLEYIKSKNYTEKNWKSLDVKFEKINPTDFDLPISSNRSKNNNKINGNVKMAIASSLALGSIGMVVATIIKEAMGFDPNTVDGIAILIGILLDMTFMLWQFVQGVNDSYKTIQKEELVPYKNRNRILKEYICWKNPNNDDSQKIFNALSETIKQQEQRQIIN